MKRCAALHFDYAAAAAAVEKYRLAVFLAVALELPWWLDLTYGELDDVNVAAAVD